MKTNLNNHVRRTYNVAEAAAVAGTGQRAIRLAIANGTIPIVRFGRKNFLIPREAFHKLVDGAAPRRKGAA